MSFQMAHSNERLHSKRDDKRQIRLGPYLALVISATIGISALIAFTFFLFTGPWKFLILFNDTRSVLIFDLCLSVAFFVQHSGMIRHAFQTWFRRFAPEYYYGAAFSIASGVCLYCVIFFWQTSEHTLVSFNNPARLAMRALFLTALAGIIWSNLALHSFDIFGMRAIRCHLRGKSQSVACFSTCGPYRWVRHPQYFFILVMIWSHPDLTADGLLFNVLWTTWIAAGARLEERDLIKAFGHRYKEYQLRVPMLIPYRLPH